MFARYAVPGMSLATVFQGSNSTWIEFLINMTILVGIDAIVTLQPP